MDKSIHVLIIPSWYPLFKGDIAGSFFREQAIALRKYGYTVGVIYPQIRGLKKILSIMRKPYGVTHENDEGINTLRGYSINFFPKFRNFNKNHWIKIGVNLFEIYIKKYGKPDIIHVHSMIHGAFVAKIIYKKYGVPYIITEHSSAFVRNLVPEKVLNSLTSVVHDAKHCLAVSQDFSKYLQSKFPLKTWDYIPNMVNEEFLDFYSLNDNENNTIISVSHLNKNKNTALLIKSFSILLKKLPNFRLVIGGDGEEFLALQGLVRDLQIEHAVRFLGNLTRDQVKQEISKSSIFVISSKYETFGVVLIEALALGKPVIATKCGGPDSVIQSNVGLLVENNSVKDLARGLLEVCTNLEKYDSELIRKYCSDNFSERAVISKLTEIYSDCCVVNE